VVFDGFNGFLVDECGFGGFVTVWWLSYALCWQKVYKGAVLITL